MLKKQQKIIFSLFLIVILLTTVFDIYQDKGEGLSFMHFTTEIIIFLSVLCGILVLWFENIFLSKEIQNKNIELIESNKESAKWKKENAVLLHGLSSAIDNQLEVWKLSPSEKDVALMILKGLSLKEIAEIRNVSERTVRQQSVNVYEKANLAGRAELSAFFLEDLLR